MYAGSVANVDQRGINNQQLEFASAREAARLLDVTPATLYAYVSRGLLHSIAAPRGRARLYSLADLKRLRTRRDARRGHTAVAAAALDWGAPVLDSSITRIDLAGPHYRGQSAVELAREERPFESVAESLWQGPAAWGPDPLARRVRASLAKLELDQPSRLARLTAYVAARGLADPDRHARAVQLERDRAARLLFGMASALAPLRAAMSESDVAVKSSRLAERTSAHGGREAGASRLASLVCSALGLAGKPRELAAVDQMLVLCADHELNVSTFTVRITASAGADLYACVTAGLCALSGASHGGVCDRFELLAEACRVDASAQADGSASRRASRASAGGTTARRTAARGTRSQADGSARRAAERVVRARLAAGELIPGFGQPLYPDGDPRGLLLLELARKHAANAPRLQTIFGILDAMSAVGRHDPTLDLGLCALSAALNLPLGAASAIFALGRVAGWVAHMLEQRESQVLLRPRARYVGA
jgi:citrate synthase